MGRKNKIPDGWLDYNAIGRCIEGTKILPFKTPLCQFLCEHNRLSRMDWFTPAMLLERAPKLRAVIDLTKATVNRYYDGKMEFNRKGIDHINLKFEGRGAIPSPDKIDQFIKTIDFYVDKFKDEDSLVGVHCTHGINRTGYLICQWLIHRMKLEPIEAINQFREARGHAIEREALINNLKQSNYYIAPAIHTDAKSSGSKSTHSQTQYRDKKYGMHPTGDRDRSNNRRDRNLQPQDTRWSRHSSRNKEISNSPLNDYREVWNNARKSPIKQIEREHQYRRESVARNLSQTEKSVNDPRHFSNYVGNIPNIQNHCYQGSVDPCPTEGKTRRQTESYYANREIHRSVDCGKEAPRRFRDSPYQTAYPNSSWYHPLREESRNATSTSTSNSYVKPKQRDDLYPKDRSELTLSDTEINHRNKSLIDSNRINQRNDFYPKFNNRKSDVEKFEMFHK